MQVDVSNKIGAQQLGYYLFFNLRKHNEGLGLTEDDVLSSAKDAGIRRRESAWHLFDRNSDSEATLDEVISSVEEVFDNRRTLTKTLSDNQTVITQARACPTVSWTRGSLFFCSCLALRHAHVQGALCLLTPCSGLL